MAVRAAQEEALQSADAWREGLRRASRTWSRPDLTALLPLMVRFWGAGASTSGVEQAFGRATKLCEGLQENSHVNDIYELLDIADADLQDIIPSAQQLWSDYYGSSRVSGVGNRETRSDCGSTRPKEPSGDGLPSMTSWLQQRKRAVSEITVGAPAPAIPELQEVWSEKHCEEVIFLQDSGFCYVVRLYNNKSF